MRRSSTFPDRAFMTSLREPSMSLDDLLAWQERSPGYQIGPYLPIRVRVAVAVGVRPLAATMPGSGGRAFRTAHQNADSVDRDVVGRSWRGARRAYRSTLAGFRGFDEKADSIHLLLPATRTARATRPPLRLVVHYSRCLTSADIHPARQPAQTRIARSLADAAAWMGTDRGARPCWPPECSSDSSASQTSARKSTAIRACTGVGLSRPHWPTSRAAPTHCLNSTS